MKTKRIALSKQSRFRIFTRDGFRCRYCGRSSEETTLEVDHIIPVAKGGTNDDANLITACIDCNRGKSDKQIGAFAPTEGERLRIAQDVNEQISSAKKAAEAAQAREQLRQSVVNYFCASRGTTQMDKKSMHILTSFAREFGCDLVFSWIDSAVIRLHPMSSDSKIGMYVSGCRRNYIKSQSSGGDQS